MTQIDMINADDSIRHIEKWDTDRTDLHGFLAQAKFDQAVYPFNPCSIKNTLNSYYSYLI